MGTGIHGVPTPYDGGGGRRRKRKKKAKPRPVKYCADCQAVIAGPDTPPRVYSAIRYCPDCARERKLWSDANAKKRFRRDRKERNRLLREENTLLRKENSELWRRVAALEKMNQEARGYV